jgi:hypothetical protein
LSIKGGKLSVKSIQTVADFAQKYVDKLSKMTNKVKQTNLNSLLTTIDKYLADVVKEGNTSSTQLKLYVLQLLKYNIEKEVYSLNREAVTSVTTVTYNCDNNDKFFIEIN